MMSTSPYQSRYQYAEGTAGEAGQMNGDEDHYYGSLDFGSVAASLDVVAACLRRACGNSSNRSSFNNMAKHLGHMHTASLQLRL